MRSELGRMSREMGRAFALARGVLGRTSPNPAVGAVLASGGRIVGEGATAPPGGAHAEVAALREAGEQARGATLYTTLEPCSHYGRTPPCTEAIIAAGVAAVVIAALDPDAQVDGRGLARLREAGVAVRLGDGAAEGAAHYEAYFHHRRTGLPFVAAKFAATLDGRIAATSGDSRWISGPEALAWAHRMRPTLDAILVGSETVLADNPQLTARPPDARGPVAQPLRVVLDSRGRIPPDARVLDDQQRAPTLIATTDASPAAWRAAIAARGAEIAVLPARGGRVDLPALLAYLGGERGVVLLLVEGGGEVLGSFFDQRLVDKVYAVVAPMLIGGDAQTAVRGAGAARMADALRLGDAQVERLGADLLVSGYPYALSDAERVRLRQAGEPDLEAIRALAPHWAELDANSVVWIAVADKSLEGMAALRLEPGGSQARLEALVVRRGAAPNIRDRLREAAEASAAGRNFRWIVAEDDPLLRRAGYRYYRRAADGAALCIKPLDDAAPEER